MNTKIAELNKLGQSLWFDYIERSLIDNGELASMIENGEIQGVTSNPSIFNTAIAKSNDYDEKLESLAKVGLTSEQIFYQLAIKDIQDAADLFMPLYESTDGGDGYVSLEVSPYLANDTQATIEEARNIWKSVNRPNLMVKIPATKSGLPAIRTCIAEGMNINVTLIFGIERYEKVMDAYLSGLEDRISKGLPINTIASVASFFVSRVDSNIDPKLDKLGTPAAIELKGKAAIANARLAYQKNLDVFSSERFEKLAINGAKIQRALWASTSTKDPNYNDVLYVDELIGPNTVNTAPPQTIVAFKDHGTISNTLAIASEKSQGIFNELAKLGISMPQVSEILEEEGVKKFADAFTELLDTIEERRKNVESQYRQPSP
jgi:transaldolase